MDYLELVKKIGIENYTIIVFLLGIITVYFFNLVDSLTHYLDDKARYFFDKRKKLKECVVNRYYYDEQIFYLDENDEETDIL